MWSRRERRRRRRDLGGLALLSREKSTMLGSDAVPSGLERGFRNNVI